MLYPVFYLYAFDVLEVLDIVHYHYQLVRNGSTISDTSFIIPKTPSQESVLALETFFFFFTIEELSFEIRVNFISSLQFFISFQ